MVAEIAGEVVTGIRAAYVERATGLDEPVPDQGGRAVVLMLDDEDARSHQSRGTFSSSASHAAALASLGIRQSPRGDIVPPALTFGPLGSADLLNWLAKKRLMKTSSHCRIAGRS